MIRFILVQVRRCQYRWLVLAASPWLTLLRLPCTEPTGQDTPLKVVYVIKSTLLVKLSSASELIPRIWLADVPFEDEEKVRVRGEVHRLIAPRDQKYQSNFVEVRILPFLLPLLSPRRQVLGWRRRRSGLSASPRRRADDGDHDPPAAVPQPQARVQALRRTLLLLLRRRKRQRAYLARGDPPLRRGSG